MRSWESYPRLPAGSHLDEPVQCWAVDRVWLAFRRRCRRETWSSTGYCREHRERAPQAEPPSPRAEQPGAPLPWLAQPPGPGWYWIRRQGDTVTRGPVEVWSDGGHLLVEGGLPPHRGSGGYRHAARLRCYWAGPLARPDEEYAEVATEDLRGA